MPTGVDLQDEHSSVSVTTTVDKVSGPGEMTVTVPLTSFEAVSVSTTVSETTTVDKVPDPGEVTVTVPVKAPPEVAVSVAVTVTVSCSSEAVAEELWSVAETEDSIVVTEVTVAVALPNVLLDKGIVTVDVVSPEVSGTAELSPIVV